MAGGQGRAKAELPLAVLHTPAHEHAAPMLALCSVLWPANYGSSFKAQEALHRVLGLAPDSRGQGSFSIWPHHFLCQQSTCCVLSLKVRGHVLSVPGTPAHAWPGPWWAPQSLLPVVQPVRCAVGHRWNWSRQQSQNWPVASKCLSAGLSHLTPRSGLLPF